MKNIVQVYRNIHKSKVAGKPVYSIRDKKTRLVVGHSSDLVLTDAEFKVNQSGRQRVLAEKRKNVHAWVEGVVAEDVDVDELRMVEVTYNPYKFEQFVLVDSWTPVRLAEVVHLSGKVRTADVH